MTVPRPFRRGLAYGCWRLAGSEGAPRPSDIDAHGRAAVHAALDAGYTVFDLADIYGGGECERIFGDALRGRPGVRDGLCVVTKCGIRRPGVPLPDDPVRYDFSGKYLRESVEGSLRRMRIESIDVLLLHRPDYLMDPHEVAGVFVQLHDAGKVRSFGVSNFRPGHLAALRRACPLPLVTHQFELSLAHIGPLDDGLMDQCLAEGIQPMAWSPLCRGALGDGDLPARDDAERARIARVRDVLDRTAAAHGTTRTVVALAWLLKHPAGIVPVVGTVNPARIAELRRAESVDLTREDWYRLLEAARGSRLP